MRGRKTWALAAAALLLAALCAFVAVEAECPNGCSGNGDCMPKDKCDCYKNYQGNDCADRTCLFGRAHVDTPKGDIDMDKSRMTPGWILDGSQQHPAKTYEYFNPDAVADEAHFYMECSNKGICDRATGLCQCFDGYEGAGCQRTTCPGNCNGHGTCESIRELASKHGGTLFGREGRVGAVNYDLWDANSTYGCRCDPWFFGPDCNKRSCKVGVDPLYLSAGRPRYETFVVHAYADLATDLGPNTWIRLRVFDYFGESYITKKIPILDEATTGNQGKNVDAVIAAIKGVPNLTFAKIKCEATELAASSLIAFKSARAAGKFGTAVTCQYIGNPGKMRIPEIASQSPKVTVKYVVTTSMQGEDEDWFTLKSPYTASAAAGTTLTLVATTPAQAKPIDLLNKLIKVGPHIVRVSSTAPGGSGTTGAPWTVTLNYELNHAISTTEPIYTADPSSLVTAGFTTNSPFTVASVSATTVTVAPASDASALATKWVKIGPNIVRVAAATNTAPFTLTLDNPLVYPIGANEPIYVEDNAISGDLPVGSDVMTFAAAHGLATGDLIFVENMFFNVQELTTDGSGNKLVRLDKPFGGNQAAGASLTGANAFKVTKDDTLKPYQYVSECSGRGMCGYDTGICTCFKGYTNDNCDRQNILAV